MTMALIVSAGKSREAAPCGGNSDRLASVSGARQQSAKRRRRCCALLNQAQRRTAEGRSRLSGLRLTGHSMPAHRRDGPKVPF